MPRIRCPRSVSPWRINNDDAILSIRGLQWFFLDLLYLPGCLQLAVNTIDAASLVHLVHEHLILLWLGFGGFADFGDLC